MPGNPNSPIPNPNVHAEAQVPELELSPPSNVPSGPGDIPIVPLQDILAKLPVDEDTGEADDILTVLFG